MTCKRLRFAVDNCLKLIFGSIGAAEIEYDILQCQRKVKNAPITGILRVHKRYLRIPTQVVIQKEFIASSRHIQKLWTSLTVCSDIDQIPCRLQVTQVAPSLLDLACARFLD